MTGVNDFANVLHFDERDILSDTHEVEYGFATRLYAKHASIVGARLRDADDRPCGRRGRAGTERAVAAYQQR